jgi:glycosyltransferase involved in cell wall biosynthesis
LSRSKAVLTVLQIIPRLNTGGVERGTVDVAKFLKNEGHRPLVISAGGKLCDALRRAEVEHVILPVDKKNPFTLLLNAIRLRRIIKKYKVDIVHARSRAPAWSAYLACKWTKTPFLTTFHGAYNFSNSWKKRYNEVMTYGSKVIAPSQFIKKHILENYSSKTSKDIIVIPRGVSMSLFNPDCVSPGHLNGIFEQFHLPLDKKIILLPGRITRWKGHLVLLQALTLLKGRDDFFCVFLGSVANKNSSYYEEITTFIQDNDLGARISIIEENEDIASFYKLAHVVVSASTDPEAFGRVMAEAGAIGRPVIASDHGGAQEIIVHGKTGWLFPSGDASTLATYLREVLSYGIRQHKAMGAEAVAHVQANFTNEAMASKTLKVYESLLKK